MGVIALRPLMILNRDLLNIKFGRVGHEPDCCERNFGFFANEYVVSVNPKAVKYAASTKYFISMPTKTSYDP